MFIVIVALSFWGSALLGMSTQFVGNYKDEFGVPSAAAMARSAIDTKNDGKQARKNPKSVRFSLVKEQEEDAGCCCFTGAFLESILKHSGYSGFVDCFSPEKKQTTSKSAKQD